VFGSVHRDSQQRSVVVTMVLWRSVLGCLVCLLGSVALGYRRYYGERQRKYGHVRGTYTRVVKACLQLNPSFTLILIVLEVLLAVIFLLVSELEHNIL
jgi:uncharacterized membrane protein YjgN (DUF898 family)